jgi:indolepyruvate decarboxylase
LFAKIATLLKKDDILIVDSGSSLFTARKIFMPDNTIFLSQSYYASLGYSLPAALGAALANPRRRIIVVIGDGAFQFTCQELSTLIKHGLAPIIFLINNDGYTIERALYKDAIYNDIQPWEYHKFSLVFGGNEGYKAKTEEELEAAIEWSKSNSGVSLIEIHLDKLDFCKDLATMLEP